MLFNPEYEKKKKILFFQENCNSEVKQKSDSAVTIHLVHLSAEPESALSNGVEKGNFTAGCDHLSPISWKQASGSDK